MVPRGSTCHGWAAPVGSIALQVDSGSACIEYGYARHRVEGHTSAKAPRCGSTKTDTRAAHDRVYAWVDLVGTSAGAEGGAIAGGWS